MSRKGRAFSFLALYANPAALDLDKLLYQGQPDPHSLVLAFAGPIRLPETVKHKGEVFGRDS